LTPLPDLRNGGSPVTGYMVMMDDGLGGAYSLVQDSLNLNLILSGLKSSRFYKIKYAARNIVYDTPNMYPCDQLEFSDPITVLTALAPSKPQMLEQDTNLLYRTALVFKWSPPKFDGGS
jgi:hypothetical protein